MEAFLKQYYAQESFIPKRILISESVEDLLPLRDWISDLAGEKVSVHHPMKGEKRRLVRMAVTNAENLLSTRTAVQEDDLMVLAKSVLMLRKTPRAIEGLDVSTLRGDQAVGTVVSFLDGLPHKSNYRNYKIKGIEGIDDYSMMSEVVSRRLSKGNPPDLFLVDGGKGHLLAVKKAMGNFPELELPDVVAIAKADEGKKSKADKIYIFGRKNPLSLRSEHPVLLFLMRIRDEAHRRAITYHRKLRGKRFKASELDQIPGIGPKKRKLLVDHFGDVIGISEAKFEDLVLIPGISSTLARNILTFFSEKNNKVSP
jgi:excinuclease ABC subunit C